MVAVMLAMVAAQFRGLSDGLGAWCAAGCPHHRRRLTCTTRKGEEGVTQE